MPKALTQKELTAIDLPKWPAMVVVGDDVTLAQAAEIIVRTNHWWATCNDRRWLATVWDALGVKLKTPGNPQDYDFASLEERVETLDPVKVEFLHNSRIMSSWIGGAHGWCNWEGKIYSRNYNIGKWPSATGIYSEWRSIAKAFPFLSLRCQLWSGETGEGSSVPVVEYVVRRGRVTARLPAHLEVTPAFEMDSVLRDYGSAPGLQGWLARERGCDELTLRSAIRAAQRARVDRLYEQTVHRLADDLAKDIDAEMRKAMEG